MQILVSPPALKDKAIHHFCRRIAELKTLNEFSLILLALLIFLFLFLFSLNG